MGTTSTAELRVSVEGSLSGIGIGVLRAEGIDVRSEPAGFSERLADLLARRAAPLSEQRDQVRLAARDMLRNGRYKPTGRGKPASEYLLREGLAGRFPRINAAVDACNFICLASLLPASVWDLELAVTDTYEVRLGRPGESYVFNAGGQVIDLQDLVIGCRVVGGKSIPMVNAVKDAHGTKTHEASTRVGALIYMPTSVVTASEASHWLEQFADLLRSAGSGEVSTAWAMPGDTVEV